jgi:hexosaminidase
VQLSVKELPKLAALGGDFYLPPPGAVVDDGKLLANTALPGSVIEFSIDNGLSWNTYTGEHAVRKSDVLLRTRLGKVTSRVTATAK